MKLNLGLSTDNHVRFSCGILRVMQSAAKHLNTVYYSDPSRCSGWQSP